MKIYDSFQNELLVGTLKDVFMLDNMTPLVDALQVVADGELPLLSTGQAYFVDYEKRKNGNLTVCYSVKVVNDHRSKKQYSIVDGTESSVDYIGEIQKGYTLIPRPNAYSIFNKTKKQWVVNEKLRLADLKIQQSDKWDKAKQARDARIDAVDLITLKNGHTYQVDGVTYLKLVSALTTANALDFTDDALLFDNFINTQNKETNLYKADLVTLITEKLALEKKIRAFYTELRNEISSTATHEALALLSINFD